MQSNFDRLTAASKVGLKINVSKTEFISDSADSDSPRFTIYRNYIKQKIGFCYLDNKITPIGGRSIDVANRINKALAVFIQLNNIWEPCIISNHYLHKLPNEIGYLKTPLKFVEMLSGGTHKGRDRKPGGAWLKQI